MTHRVNVPNEDEWLWGWDPTPGIVSVWAEPDGRATVWRREPETKQLVREDVRFCLCLPPEEQYLVASGRTYFRGLAFDDLRRMQFDLETTGLDPARDRIFMVAVRDPDGRVGTIEGPEADLVRRLARTVAECDPDV